MGKGGANRLYVACYAYCASQMQFSCIVCDLYKLTRTIDLHCWPSGNQFAYEMRRWKWAKENKNENQCKDRGRQRKVLTIAMSATLDLDVFAKPRKSSPFMRKLNQYEPLKCMPVHSRCPWIYSIIYFFVVVLNGSAHCLIPFSMTLCSVSNAVFVYFFHSFHKIHVFYFRSIQSM